MFTASRSQLKQCGFEYCGKFLTKIKVISKDGVFYIIWTISICYSNTFTNNLKYSKQFISIRNTVFLSFIYWCYYGCFCHSVCIQVYLLYHFKSNLWLSVLFIYQQRNALFAKQNPHQSVLYLHFHELLVVRIHYYSGRP